MTITTITGYRFIHIDANTLSNIAQTLRTLSNQHELKGTILLSEEGINLSVSGMQAAIQTLTDHLSKPPFRLNVYRTTYSQIRPFKKMLVRIKKEIITMHCPEIKTEQATPTPYLSPHTFVNWHKQNKDIIVLDVRNDYEVTMGSFKNAQHLNMKTFSEFPEKIRTLNLPPKKTIVTFCTGGIRCEKATQYMRHLGFQHVYQLEGGIINYFNTCDHHYFEGNCFVFDNRISIESPSNS